MSSPPTKDAPPAYTSQPYSPPAAGEYSTQYVAPSSMSYSQDNSYEMSRSRHQYNLSNVSDNSNHDSLKPTDEEHSPTAADANNTQTQKDVPLHEAEKARIPGKYWLSRTRIYLYLMCWLMSVVTLVFGVMALFAYYWTTRDLKSKPVVRTSDGWSVVDRTLPGQENAGEIMTAWPDPANLSPTLLQLGAAAAAVLYFLTVLGYPCFSSDKRYYKYTGFEIYEIVGAVVMFLASIASFAYAKHAQYNKDLWGWSCQRREDAPFNLKFGESKLFPDVKYAQTCNDLNNTTYILLGIGILTFFVLLTWIFGALYAAGSKKRGYSRAGYNSGTGTYVVGGSASSALAASACCDGLLVCCLACTNCLTACNC